MGYVDINPIRAGMAKTPKLSDYTSIRERLRPSVKLHTAIKEMQGWSELKSFNQPIRPLNSFVNVSHVSETTMLPMSFRGYLQLIDTTGRIVRGNGLAVIDQTFTLILDRLQLSEDQWIHATSNFEQMYRRRQRIA
jgi:hypothetical protein